MKKSISIVLFISCFFSLNLIFAQSIQGVIRDFDDDHLIEGAVVTVKGLDVSTTTNNVGKFLLDYSSPEDFILVITSKKYNSTDKIVNGGSVGNIGTIVLSAINSDSNFKNDVDVFEVDADNESDDDNVYSLLSASRDLFTNTASFGFRAASFKIRGYNSEYTSQYLNGAIVNNLNDGRAFWSVWGGLNDVLRAREDVVNIDKNDFGFGNIGGSSNLDLRASSQREGIKASYAASNRSYRNRLMATVSTGMMNSGWALTVSGSKRWGNAGYIPGTFYDAYSYFVSVDKKLSDRHMLNFVLLGAPVKRGKRSSSTQEANDLAGSNFYNSNWGYQGGKVRNARIVNAHQPVGILRHDWEVSDRMKLTTTAMAQVGTYGQSRLEWTDAPDPRPDYYRNLPSYQLTESLKNKVTDYFKINPEKLQLDWDEFYRRNHYVKTTTILDVDGNEGNDVVGRNALYALGEAHYDNQKISLQTHMNFELSESSSLNAGVYYRHEKVKNYQLLIDLLGADFYLDIDKFAKRDAFGDANFYQSDLNHPNRLAYVGDKIRYNYDIVTSRPGLWLQYAKSLNKLDFYLGADYSISNFYRDGKMKNGKFPDRSFGKSETQSLNNYAAKAGLSYKINGRNYINLNTAFISNSIGARYAFASARTRSDLIRNLDNKSTTSVDLSYHARYTTFKAKASIYYTKFENKVYNRSFYLDDVSNSAFVNYIMTGINTEHKGIELAIEKELGRGFSIKGVAAFGDYRIKSRPEINKTLDNSAVSDGTFTTGYLKNYLVPNTPQIAYNATLSYNSPNYWFANLSFNYFDKMYLDFYPHRRTSEYVKGVSKTDNPELWNDILRQEQVPANFTMDIFGGKSWKIKNYFINTIVGVNNILNNTSFRTGGYEQTRFDVENKNVNKYPPKYFYGYGTNYYVSIGIRLNEL